MKRAAAKLTGDRLLSDGRFFQKLCQKTGLRSFDEFWEKYFEIQGLCMESETWFEMLLGYCRMIREDTPPEQIRSEAARPESSLWQEGLRKKAAEVGEEAGAWNHRRIHTPALAEYLREQTKLKEWKEQAKKGEEGIYLMALFHGRRQTLGRLCQAVCLFPAFTRRIWEKLEEK